MSPDGDRPSAPAAGANAELYGGWPMILSGLKTLLETGETLTTPGSLDMLSYQWSSDDAIDEVTSTQCVRADQP